MLAHRLLIAGGGSSSFSPGEPVIFHGCIAAGLDRFVGTVSKTSGSGTITGSGTAFLTAVKIGYKLHIPGGAVDEFDLYVTAIASDTSLTVSPAPTSTASGQLCEPDQEIGNATFTPVKYEYDRLIHSSLLGVYDTDNYHYSSSANLTGTVAKTSGNTTITGTGTAFLTGVAVNQVIDVPGGGGTDTLVIRTIASDTSLTVWRAPSYTASGQTAKNNPAAIAIPIGLGGYYDIGIEDDWRYGIGTVRQGNVFLNLSTGVAATPGAALGGVNMPRVPTSGETAYKWAAPRKLAEGDFIVNRAYQDSGSSVSQTPYYAMWVSYRGPV